MEKLNDKIDEWKRSNAEIFWGEIAPGKHVLQIYENDDIFIKTLTEFTTSGLNTGEHVVLICTPGHINKINSILVEKGYDLQKISNKYFPINAHDLLRRFMVNSWPDEYLFEKSIDQILSLTNRNNGKVRAFGEMVALLWAEGKNGATVQLERLWNQLHKKKLFTLYCAYPKIGFTQDINVSASFICQEHAKIIDGHLDPDVILYYNT